MSTNENVQQQDQAGNELDRGEIIESAAAENFDWEEAEGYGPQRRRELANMYEKTLSDLNEQEIVTGRIVGFDDRMAIVNVGFKSEGIIPVSEFKELEDELEVGKEVEVYLLTLEDSEGQMILSRRMAKSMRTWDYINQAMENDEVLDGYVKRRTKGGFVVDIFGIEAFLPGSQIDVKPVRDYDAYVDQRMDFKVVKINQQQHNVVISHKALIEKDLEDQRRKILDNLERGQVLEGTVKNITNFGAFIDLGGVDGLLHITDISWGRINSPDEVLTLDDTLNVVVLDFDEEKKRISLGLKQLQPHPWDNLPEDVTEGSTVKGKVVTIADYGIFLEVQPGVEGLVHVSEMSWSQHPKNPYDLYQVGDEVDAVVLMLDKEERKMSLGIKQLTEDPWNSIVAKYPVGTRATGTVRNITNYGIFVELEEGVDGLIHVGDLSWFKKINHPSEFVEKDQELEVVVLELDLDERKLRLGHKQLTEDPWEKMEDAFPIDSEHQGTITKLSDKGAVVELEYGLEGFAPSKHLKTESGEDLSEGDHVAFRVIEFNKDQKKILLSHTKVWKEEAPTEESGKKKAKKKKPEPAKSSEPERKETLGDLEQLSALKQQMEHAEKTSSSSPASKPQAEPEPAPKPSESEAEAKADEAIAAEPEAKADETDEADTQAAEAKTDETTSGDPETQSEEADATQSDDADATDAESKESDATDTPS